MLLLSLVLILAAGVWAAVERAFPVAILAVGCVVMLLALHPSLSA